VAGGFQEFFSTQNAGVAAQDYRPPDARHCVDQEQGESHGRSGEKHLPLPKLYSLRQHVPQMPQEADRNLQITRMGNPRMVQVGLQPVRLLPRDFVEWFQT
jgi:hypothetical protein